ncbi:hypothetical protein GE061_012710 [Apolygus lucorum]|uniref:Reelin domain-containing protein n=1 Tax=Apolygus lucorum TaxID=248454 RepID=A0A8S9XUE0_APOLU|nr:hypothetical protein GE061_012710 [Apolygus lucorum]
MTLLKGVSDMEIGLLTLLLLPVTPRSREASSTGNSGHAQWGWRYKETGSSTILNANPPQLQRTTKLSGLEMKGTAVILVVALAGAAYGFPAVGVPHQKQPHPEVPKAAICDTMEVGHGWPAQNSPSPYTIELSDTKVAPKGTITVTISSNKGQEPFRGLVVQGRCGDKPVGTFLDSSLIEGSTYTDCDGKRDAYTFITKDGNQYKNVLTWQAPPEPQDCRIVFYVSTVKTYNTYWVKQRSQQELEVSE